MKKTVQVTLTLIAALSSQSVLAQNPAELDALTGAQLGVTRDFIRETTEKLNALSSQNAANPEFEHYDFVVKKRKKLERLEKVLIGLEQFLAGTYTKELTKITTKYSTIHQSQQYSPSQKETLLKGVKREFNTVVKESLRPTLNSFILKAASAACLNCIIPSQYLGDAVELSNRLKKAAQLGSEYGYSTSSVPSNGPFFSPATYTQQLFIPPPEEFFFGEGKWLNEFEMTVTDVHANCLSSSCVALSRNDIADTLERIAIDLIFPVRVGTLTEYFSLVPAVGVQAGYVRRFKPSKHEHLERDLPYSLSQNEWEQGHVEAQTRRTAFLAQAYRDYFWKRLPYALFDKEILDRNRDLSEERLEKLREVLNAHCAKPNIPGGAFCLRTEAERIAFAERILEFPATEGWALPEISKDWRKKLRRFFAKTYLPEPSH
jgi:hypothetical protein